MAKKINLIIVIFLIVQVASQTKSGHRNDDGGVGGGGVLNPKQRDNHKRSLVFIFDASQSMKEDLNQMIKAISYIANEFTKFWEAPIENYILVQFRDPEISEYFIYTDKNELIKKLKQVRLYGNIDCPEQSLKAIHKGLTTPALNDKSYMFIFTDASSKERQLMPNIKKLIQKKRTELYFFISGRCDEDAVNMNPSIATISQYHELAESSNGVVFEVGRGDIENILKNVGRFSDQKRSLLEVIRSGGGTNARQVEHKVTIDDTISEFTVILTGENVSFVLLDPYRKPFIDYEILVNLTNTKMFRVTKPISGNWNIKVQASSDYSGQITVISDVEFTYGFSTLEPTSISNTAYHPLKNTPNYISVATLGGGDLIPTSVDLFFNNKKHNHNLTQVDGGDNMFIYTTIKVLLPNVPFQVYVNAKDKDGNEITRLISPEISATTSMKPEMKKSSVNVAVDIGDPIDLLCEVTSLEKVEIVWYKNEKKLKSVNAGQSETLKLAIANAKSTDNGKYICMATNTIGTSVMEVNVKVEAIELTVTTDEVQIEVKEGEGSSSNPLEIPCNVSPKDSTIKWFFYNQVTLPEGATISVQGTLKFNNVNRDIDGEYTCVGIRPNGKKKFVSITVNVNYAPKIVKFDKNQDGQIDDILAQYRLINLVNFQQFSLVCDAIGKPKPQILWTRNLQNISSESILNIRPTDGEEASGRYECVASNKIGNSPSKLVQVNMITKPTFDNSTSATPHIVPENLKSYNVTCPVKNFSKSMNISWTFDGKPINLTSNEYEMIGNKLMIHKLSLKHQGDFRCLVLNEAGKLEVILNLKINIEPQITLFTVTKDGGQSYPIFNDTIDIVNGEQTLTVDCEVTGNPIPATHWMWNGEHVSSTSKLILTELQDSMSHDYVCMSENSMGKAERTIKVNVEKIPEIQPNQLRLFQLSENDSLTVECPVKNSINILWYHNSNPNPIMDVRVSNGKLHFSKINPEEAGTYRCEARNEAGAVAMNITIDVLFKPRDTIVYTLITRNPVDSKVEEKRYGDVQLKCEGKGNPNPEVYWTAVQKQLPFKSNVLVLNQIEFNDAGVYSCVVENSQGTQTLNVTVKVNDQPRLIDNEGYVPSSGKDRKRQFISILDSIPLPNTNSNQEYVKYVTLRNLDSTILNCSSTGVPMPKIRWFKNGNVWLGRNNRPVQYLHYVSIGDIGIYECRQENALGAISVFYHVDVKSDAENMIASKMVDGRNKVTIKCSSDGNYLPVIDIVNGNRQRIATNRKFLRNASIKSIQKLLVDGKEILLDSEGNEIDSSHLTVSQPNYSVLTWWNNILSISHKLDDDEQLDPYYECVVSDPELMIKIKSENTYNVIRKKLENDNFTESINKSFNFLQEVLSQK